MIDPRGDRRLRYARHHARSEQVPCVGQALSPDIGCRSAAQLALERAPQCSLTRTGRRAQVLHAQDGREVGQQESAGPVDDAFAVGGTGLPVAECLGGGREDRCLELLSLVGADGRSAQGELGECAQPLHPARRRPQCDRTPARLRLQQRLERAAEPVLSNADHGQRTRSPRAEPELRRRGDEGDRAGPDGRAMEVPWLRVRCPRDRVAVLGRRAGHLDPALVAFGVDRYVAYLEGTQVPAQRTGVELCVPTVPADLRRDLVQDLDFACVPPGNLEPLDHRRRNDSKPNESLAGAGPSAP